MGRRMRLWNIKGYLIVSPNNPDYTPQRDALILALEQDGPGQLVHPTLGMETVMVETYSVMETREKGGYCEFDMLFVERGQPVQYDASQASGFRTGQVDQQATVSAQTVSTSLDANLGSVSSLTNGAPAAWNAGLAAG